MHRTIALSLSKYNVEHTRRSSPAIVLFSSVRDLLLSWVQFCSREENSSEDQQKNVERKTTSKKMRRLWRWNEDKKKRETKISSVFFFSLSVKTEPKKKSMQWQCLLVLAYFYFPVFCFLFCATHNELDALIDCLRCAWAALFLMQLTTTYVVVNRRLPLDCVHGVCVSHIPLYSC